MQDGAVAQSSLRWRVEMLGDGEPRVLAETTGASVVFVAPAPRSFASLESATIEVTLTATDSHGASESVRRTLTPRRVAVALTSVPAGLTLAFGDSSVQTPATLVSWDGLSVPVTAASQSSQGKWYTFETWSNGGAQSHLFVTPSGATSLTANFRMGSAGTGLSATYYDNMDFTGAKVERIDETVNFDWRLGSPAAGIGVDTFSVRWKGRIEALRSETYTFYFTSDDGVRIWVNGRLVVDDWTLHSATTNRFTLAMAAGEAADIQIDYFENLVDASAKLEWSSASTPRQVVPRTQLYPAAGTVLTQRAAPPTTLWGVFVQLLAMAWGKLGV